MRRLRLLASSLLVASFLVGDDETKWVIEAFSTSSSSFAPMLPSPHRQQPSSWAARTKTSLRSSNPPGPVERPSERSTLTKTNEAIDNNASIEAELQGVYQRVAQRDPAWFDAYVVPAWDITMKRGTYGGDGEDDSALPATFATWRPTRALGPPKSEQPKEPSGPTVDELVAELARLDESYVRLTQTKPKKPEAAVAASTATNQAVASAPGAVAAEPIGVPSLSVDLQQEPPSVARPGVVVDEVDAADPSPASSTSDAEVDSAVAGAAGAVGVNGSSQLEPVAMAAAATAASAAASSSESSVEASESLVGPPDSTLAEGGDRIIDRAPAEAMASTEPLSVPSTASASAVTTTEPADGRVVVYRDAASAAGRGEFVVVPYSKLEGLGYREADVLSLRPEALDLIVAERVPRPRSGVPDRWKRRPSPAGDDDSVRVVPVAKVKELTEGRTPRPPMKSEAPPTTTLELDTAPPEMSRGADDKERTEASPRQDPTRRAADSRDPTVVSSSRREPASASRYPERRSRGEEGRSKPIYSGRPVRRDRAFVALADPPKPSAFWPDIDTFRDLLRREASLRLRILGNDWAGVVKDESDWRLDLYKSWLWTLHNGVGDPIVESRSDRMRRAGTGSSTLPPVPLRKSPSPKARGGPTSRERKRPNPETT